MKAIIVSVVVALAAIVSWFVSYDEPQPQVTVLLYPSSEQEEASAAVQGESVMSSHAPASSAASAASASVEQSRYKEYKSPVTVQAFKNRRDKILSEHWRTVNVPRLNQGFERLEPPKIAPTAEEIAAMIPDLQAKAREIAQATKEGFDNQVNGVLWDLRDVGVSVQELDGSTISLLNQLGQSRADEEAVLIRKQLEKGCHGTAGYLMDTVIHQISLGLEHPASMGYVVLHHRIRMLQEAERQYAAASTEEATQAVVRNLIRQRQPICGSYG